MVLLFQFWPLDRDDDNVFFWPISKFDWNHLLGKSLFPKACIVIFKVNNHLPSDIRCFQGEIKCWTKSKVTPQIMLLLNSTFFCWKRHTPTKTDTGPFLLFWIVLNKNLFWLYLWFYLYLRKLWVLVFVLSTSALKWIVSYENWTILQFIITQIQSG